MEDWSPFNTELVCGIDVSFRIFCAQSAEGLGTITRIEQVRHRTNYTFSGQCITLRWCRPHRREKEAFAIFIFPGVEFSRNVSLLPRLHLTARRLNLRSDVLAVNNPSKPKGRIFMLRRFS